MFNHFSSPQINIRKKRIGKALREMVWDKKFGTEARSGLCSYCSKKIEITNFECDHITPEAKGGQTCIENLQPICKSCNGSKGTQSHNDFKLPLMTNNEKVNVAQKLMSNIFNCNIINSIGFRDKRDNSVELDLVDDIYRTFFVRNYDYYYYYYGKNTQIKDNIWLYNDYSDKINYLRNNLLLDSNFINFLGINGYLT